MTIEELVVRYIANTRQVFQQIEKRSKDRREAEANRILDHTKRYLDDAEYYHDQKRFETALASVAYCEGLLDALRLLGLVKFEWPTERKQEKTTP